jgi:hypothetical protein
VPGVGVPSAAPAPSLPVLPLPSLQPPTTPPTGATDPISAILGTLLGGGH